VIVVDDGGGDNGNGGYYTVVLMTVVFNLTLLMINFASSFGNVSPKTRVTLITYRWIAPDVTEAILDEG